MSWESEVPFPFSVARGSRRTLVEQTVDGLKQCILSGVYKSGDVLPTTRALAEKLGVSRIVTLAAVRELTEAGFVNPRPGVGSVVLGGKGKLWKGRVILVTRGLGCEYYSNVFAAGLRDALIREGWLLTQVCVRPEAPDLSELEIQLTHPVDLVMILFDNDPARKVVEKSGVPFVTIGSVCARRRKNHVGSIRYCNDGAADALAEECVRTGIADVEIVATKEGGCLEVDMALKRKGVRVIRREIGFETTKPMPVAVAYAARDSFARRLAAEKPRLPDLFFFSDDYLCEGALAAMDAAGVRAPDDVRVVSWGNEGNEPVYARNLSLIMSLPRKDAEVVSRSVIEYLGGGIPSFAFDLGAGFVLGET